MKDPRITEEVKEQIAEIITSSFLCTPFVETNFPDQEDADIEFYTSEQGDLIFLTLGPVDASIIEANYTTYKNAANEWANKKGLAAEILTGGTNIIKNEIIFSFTIDDLDKLLTPELAFDPKEVLTGIQDRAHKIQKHSMDITISPTDATELNGIYERLRAIEANCDVIKAQAGIAKPGATMAKPGQKFWVTLLDRNGRQKDRMEVTFAEERYARSAFEAAGNTVHATDVIKFE